MKEIIKLILMFVVLLLIAIFLTYQLIDLNNTYYGYFKEFCQDKDMKFKRIEGGNYCMDENRLYRIVVMEDYGNQSSWNLKNQKLNLKIMKEVVILE